MGSGSALDDVVYRGDVRLAGIGPELPHDRQQRGPEGIEWLLGRRPCFLKVRHGVYQLAGRKDVR